MEQTLTRPLTRAQQARRQRVIDAAMALGLEGGYEAVQMRDVAARADVAMGTVYRYFTSKDHLLAATLVHWVELLDSRIGQHPPRGDHPADRVLDVLDRALRAMGRQPKLVTAVFTSLSSPDPAAVGCQQQITLLMEGIISRAMGERDVPDFADRARMIGHVWYSALVGWVNGWSNMGRVHDELVVAVGLLLLSRLEVGTSLTVAALYMFILGMGLGSVMQVLVLLVQNAVPYSELGVATSAATFFRSIGGSFGTAIAGAIFSNVLVGNLVRHLGVAKLPR